MIDDEEVRPRARPAEFPAETGVSVDEADEADPRVGDGAEGVAPALVPPPSAPRRRPLRWFAGGVAGLLVVGLALDTADLLTRAFQAGWAPGLLVSGALATAGIGLVVGLVREAAALARLRDVERLRVVASRARDAGGEGGDTAAARVLAIYAGRPGLEPALARLRDLIDDAHDGAEVVRLVEIELLSVIDRAAFKLVSRAARDTALVTALSPAALIDAAIVMWRNGRMIREVAALYGARPGWLGSLRLTRGALIGLATAGATESAHHMAVDALGGTLTAAVSTRVGTGLVNGLMTARLGLSAMRLVRPIPFALDRAPGLGPIRAELLKLPGDAAP